MSRRATQYGSLASALLVLVCSIASTIQLPVRAAVTIGHPTAYLLSPPDPIIAERSEQTYRGWRSIPTPVPTPLATPVRPPKATPEPATPKPRPGLIWPVHGRITTYFSAAHPAIDIAAPLGTPVKAACSGKVIYAAWKNNGGGNVVDIACSNGLTVNNNHMSAISAVLGQAVTQGGIVGLVGMTGHATGPHVHFAVIRGGRFVNPLGYLP